MRTKIRTFTESINNKDELSPMLKWGFVVVILYSLFGGLLIESYPNIYLLGLFFVFPIFTLLWIAIRKIIPLILKLNIVYVTVASIWLTILVLYLISSWDSFLHLLLFYSFFVIVGKYVLSLDEKYKIRLSRVKEESYNRGIFKNLLEDKNFHNHHNYLNSQQNKQIYISQTRNETIIAIIKYSLGLPWFVFMTGFDMIFKAPNPLETFLGMYLTMIIMILVFFFGFKFINNKIMKKNGNIIELYQAKTVNSKYLKYRNKIFFY